MVWYVLLWSLSLWTTQAQHRAREQRADDVSISSLDVLVQQQADVIQSLQAKLASVTNRLTVLENDNTALKTKVATLSRRVAFTVRFKADDAVNGIAVGAHSVLRFDDVTLNTGDGYDAQTGIFTAPVAGTYAFFLTQMGANARGSTLLNIQNHGRTLDLVYSKDHEDQGSSLVTAHLGAGEQVWVQQYSGSAVRGAWYTIFSGYLVQAD